MISLDDRKEMIIAQPVFSNLTEDETYHLAKHLTEKTFDKNTSIVIEGATVDCIYLIVDGTAEVRHVTRQNNELRNIAITNLGPKDAIGLSPTGFFSPTDRRSATVVATEKVTALCLSFAKLKEFMRTHPHLNDSVKKYVRNYFGV